MLGNGFSGALPNKSCPGNPNLDGKLLIVSIPFSIVLPIKPLSGIGFPFSSKIVILSK